MLRATEAEPTEYALAVARNSHAWENWGRLFGRYRQALIGELAPKCPTCGGEVQGDLSCACFELIAGE